MLEPRIMADQIISSIGFHGCYGLSAAFDFRTAIETVTETDATSDSPLNILLINPGDVRHIILTISRRRRDVAKHTRKLRPLHFYLMESPIEVIARDLLLLEVLNDYEVPIRQRANVFLEIYGNCCVQGRTSRYIEQLGYQLRELVASGTGRLEDSISFSLMRYKDMDDFEAALKNCSSLVEFDIDRLRDQRIRGR
jgi:dynein assembly factor 3, axonemal